jgi:hypothetical protein
MHKTSALSSDKGHSFGGLFPPLNPFVFYDMRLEEISTESVIKKIYEGGVN